MTRLAVTKIAGTVGGGTAGGLPAAVLISHGIPGLIAGAGLVGLGMLIGAIAPDLLLHRLADKAAEHQRWQLSATREDEKAVRRELLTRNPYTEIARFRGDAGTSHANNHAEKTDNGKAP